MIIIIITRIIIQRNYLLYSINSYKFRYVIYERQDLYYITYLYKCIHYVYIKRLLYIFAEFA